MKGLLTLLSIILMLPAQAQNLVLDGSFEDTTTCGYWTQTTMYALLQQWAVEGADEVGGIYFNSCYNGFGHPTYGGTPQNYIGYEPPHSGQGYACVITYLAPGGGGGGRCWAFGKLSQTLQAGKRYRVSLYVSLCDSSIYACHNFQVYFSDTFATHMLPTGIALNITHPPEAAFHQSLKNKEGWTKLDTTFIAAGNEHYISLGNFIGNAQSDGEYVGGNPLVTWSDWWFADTVRLHIGRIWGAAGYYLDDVSVVLDDDTGLEGVGEAGVQVFPNPNQGAFTVALARPGMGVVEVFDLLGRQVFTAPLQGQGRQELHPNLAKGIYACNVIQNGQVVLQTKLVVQ